MRLAHTPGAITFAVRISPPVSEVEPGRDHPMHILKLACAKWLGMLSSSLHSMFAPTTDLSHW